MSAKEVTNIGNKLLKYYIQTKFSKKNNYCAQNMNLFHVRFSLYLIIEGSLQSQSPSTRQPLLQLDDLQIFKDCSVNHKTNQGTHLLPSLQTGCTGINVQRPHDIVVLHL